jgi:hypothetical protein
MQGNEQQRTMACNYHHGGIRYHQVAQERKVSTTNGITEAVNRPFTIEALKKTHRSVASATADNPSDVGKQAHTVICGETGPYRYKLARPIAALYTALTNPWPASF